MTTADLLTALARGTADRAAVLAELASRGISAGGGTGRPVGADLDPGDLYGPDSSEEE